MKQFHFTDYVNKALFIVLMLRLLSLTRTYLAPFIISLLASVLLASFAEPMIRFLCRRGLKRSRCALFVIPLLLLVICFILVFFGVVLGNQVEQFLRESNDMIQSLSALLPQVQNRLNGTYLGSLSLWQHLERWLNNLDIRPFVKTLTGFAAAFPGLLLSATVVLLSSFQLAAHRTEIFPFLGRQLSPKTAAMVLKLKEFLQRTVLQWLKAQAILFFVAFGMLSLGFWFLDIPGWLFIAIVTSLLDALPVIGAGMIILPWALVCFFMGNATLALELTGVYAIMEVTRNLLEPRILSAQLGLPPFVTLCSLYLGFTLMGIGGMLAFPLVALSLIKLQEWGYLKLWK